MPKGINLSLKTFLVTEQKALVRAECSDVPALMIIAGPNGVGKSSLLFALKRRIGCEFDAETKFSISRPIGLFDDSRFDAGG